MTGRDVARHLLGVAGRGQAGDVGDLPLTIESLRELTGDDWRQLDIPAAGTRSVYDALAHTRWMQMEEPGGSFWEEGFLFATRHEGWLILYGAQPQEEREMGPSVIRSWIVLITHPEMDRPSAETAARTLMGVGPYTWAMELESQQLPYVLYIDQSTVAAKRLHLFGLLPLQFIPSPGVDLRAWVTRSVAINKAAVRLLRERS